MAFRSFRWSHCPKNLRDRSPMISESDALSVLLNSLPNGVDEETLPLLDGLHRRSSRQVRATLALPGFDNSMMDGYAVRSIETQSAAPLEVVATQPAGPDLRLSLAVSRQAIRIYTGAPIPSGADAVIMQEDVLRVGDTIICQDPVAMGENIRRQGSDLCPGQILLQPGDGLTPGRIGLLASQGLTHASVYRLPRIAILSTGDELVPGGTVPLLPGQLYNSNGLMLAALLKDKGFPVSELAHSGDTLEETTTVLERLAALHDVILLSGGVSVGDKDFVKPALNALGLPPQIWRIRVKPGKPFLFAHRPKPGPLFVFGLPGNPVSAFVTFQLFVRPALLKWSGAPDSEWALPGADAILGQDLSNPGDRPHYLRGHLREGVFRIGGLQRSDALFALAQSNALLRMEPGQSLTAGTTVALWKV